MMHLESGLEKLTSGLIWYQHPKGDPPSSFYFCYLFKISLNINCLCGLLLPKVNLFLFLYYQIET